MKSLGTNLASHVAGEVLTVARCIMIVRTDGTRMGFTDHPRTLSIDIGSGAEDYSPVGGFSATAHGSDVGLQDDNMDFLGVIDSTRITSADLKGGKYAGAKVYVFDVNYSAIADGIIKIDYGEIGQITIADQTWQAQARSIAALLEQIVGAKHGRYCRATLGDSRCGVNLASYTTAGTVDGVTDKQTFADSSISEAVNYFRFGVVTWVTGDNAGLSMDVKTSGASGEFVLKFPMPFAIQVGDTFNASAGCSLILKMPGDVWGSPYTGDCRAKFNNAVNFVGEPDIPGADEILRGAR